MHKGFWQTIQKPIIALSPMDGVTDAAFRYITDKYGHPHILFTEFTNVEGISRGAQQLLHAFIHHDTPTPTVGQIFGADPEAFYRATFVLAEMGFDGIDINMGCPDRNVARHGGGAGLIRQPKLAQEILKQTKQATLDWAEGRSIDEVGLPDSIIQFVEGYRKKWQLSDIRRYLPVSVKTRIGYDTIVTEDWISTLLEMEPAAISLHGRTLKQLYSGLADWDEIAKAAMLVKKTETVMLGNGDIKSIAEAHEKTIRYGTDGALIGRAAFGNPWIFTQQTVGMRAKFDIALEHCRAFTELTPDLHFLSLRKHMGWYCRGFNDATGHRMRLMQATTLDQVEDIITDIKRQI